MREKLLLGEVAESGRESCHDRERALRGRRESVLIFFVALLSGIALVERGIDLGGAFDYLVDDFLRERREIESGIHRGRLRLHLRDERAW